MSYDCALKGHCNHDADSQVYIGHVLKASDPARVRVDGVDQVAPVHCCQCGRVADQPAFDPAVIAALRPTLTLVVHGHGAFA